MRVQKMLLRKTGGVTLGISSATLAIIGIWEHSGEWGLTAVVVLLGAIAVMPQDPRR